MKTSNQKLFVKTALITGVATLLLTGCLTKNEEASFNSDGQSSYLTTELDQMGQIYMAGAAAKNSASEVTVSSELVIMPFAYDSACACFIRKAKFTTSEGYERMRIDTVTFKDAEGMSMSVFIAEKVAQATHTRNVTRVKGGREADIRFSIKAEIMTDAGVKKGVWNGTMTGTYNGQLYKSGTITNITRIWSNGYFGFPTMGKIELERPVFQLSAEFLGDGKAQFKITNKAKNKTHLIYVDKNYTETDPVETP